MCKRSDKTNRKIVVNSATIKPKMGRASSNLKMNSKVSLFLKPTEYAQPHHETIEMKMKLKKILNFNLT